MSFCGPRVQRRSSTVGGGLLIDQGGCDSSTGHGHPFSSPPTQPPLAEYASRLFHLSSVNPVLFFIFFQRRTYLAGDKARKVHTQFEQQNVGKKKTPLTVTAAARLR